MVLLEVVDSHTEGEPTRVVVGGWPELRATDMLGRREELQQDWDHLRGALVCEPRGHDALVGAILTKPVTPGAAAGIIFCNNVGYLGMCGHGTIGVVKTLHALGRLAPGSVTFDTPAGTVAASLNDDGSVTVENVASYVSARDVTLDVPTVGRVTGDVAYGGNWFFLTEVTTPLVRFENVDELLHVSSAIRNALRDAGITGRNGEEIDHVELFGPAERSDADSKNFVLCPGNEYDRSPCGTGTSAKMALLVTKGALAPGAHWAQESIVGSRFVGYIERRGDALIPFVNGCAYITSKATLELDERDPFRYGFHNGAKR